MLGSDCLVSPLSSCVAPNSYGWQDLGLGEANLETKDIARVMQTYHASVSFGKKQFSLTLRLPKNGNSRRSAAPLSIASTWSMFCRTSLSPGWSWGDNFATWALAGRCIVLKLETGELNIIIMIKMTPTIRLLGLLSCNNPARVSRTRVSRKNELRKT